MQNFVDCMVPYLVMELSLEVSCRVVKQVAVSQSTRTANIQSQLTLNKSGFNNNTKS